MKITQPFLTSAHLKRLALSFMVIDHLAVAIVIHGIFGHPFLYSDQFLDQMIPIYTFMRLIGRLAFPIYLFLLLEGFYHTRQLKQYFLRLGALAIISELPFDLALNQAYFDWSSQNVFFELFAILLLFYWLDRLKGRWLVQAIVVLAIAGIAYAGHFDYGYWGVLAGTIFFFARGSRWREVLAVFPAFAFEYFLPSVFLSSLLIASYNGKRGKLNAAFHYWAYPGHLMVLYLVYLWLYSSGH